MTFTFSARPGNSCVDSYSVCSQPTYTYPPPICVMTQVRDFVADLLRGGTSAKEVKKLADSSFEDKSLKMRAIFDILKLIKEGKSPMTEGI